MKGENVATAAATDSAPGWRPFGKPAEVAEWDGHAWTGRTRPDPEVDVPEAGRHHPFAFFAHAWFWLVVSGWIVTVTGAILGTTTETTHWWWLVIAGVGLAISLYGFLLIFNRHQRFAELENLPVIVGAGLGSGLIASAIAYLVETLGRERLGISPDAILWLAGPIEETAKLLVPVVLWCAVATRFRDPRAGFLTVLVSGSTFGVVEGIKYIAQHGTDMHLLMGIVRTPAEMGHPLWTGIAAALIWLAAYRAGRLRTLAGLVGWCVAMALHSFHDGVFTLAPGKDRGPVVMDEQLLVADAFWSSLISLAFLVLGYLILRHLARELVPPGAVRTNRPH